MLETKYLLLATFSKQPSTSLQRLRKTRYRLFVHLLWADSRDERARSANRLTEDLLHDDPEHELLLTLVGTAERRQLSEQRIQQLLAIVDWSRLEDLLEHSRLFPSLGPRLAELAPTDAAPAFGEALTRARQTAGGEEIMLQITFEKVHAALAERGIRSALLKGPPLGLAAYGEAGRRLSSDIDVLVAAEELNDAAAILRELGYAPPTDHLEAGGLPLLHLTMVHSEGRLPPVELHWRIHWYERDFARRRLLPSEPGSPSEWRPAPAAELAALLLFYARDGFTGLRYPSDLGAWWDRHGTELDAADLERILVSHQPVRGALLTALAVAERTIGIPSRRLVGNRALGLRGRMAVRLADPYPYPSLQQAYAEIGLIDGLLAPRRKLREYARRQIAPSPAVIREHAEKAGEQAVSRFGYGIRTLARCALALSRVAGLPLGSRIRFAR